MVVGFEMHMLRAGEDIEDRQDPGLVVCGVRVLQVTGELRGGFHEIGRFLYWSSQSSSRGRCQFRALKIRTSRSPVSLSKLMITLVADTQMPVAVVTVYITKGTVVNTEVASPPKVLL